MRNQAIPLLLLVAAGCGPVQRKTQFDEAEYAPYGKPGTSAIVGQAFLKTRAGDVKYGAGNTVYLNPVTNYSREWFELHVLGGKNLAPADSRINQYIREARADGQGGFEFQGIPAGEYYVTCHITWLVPNGTIWPDTTGGWAFAKVKATEGQPVRCVVTR